MKKTSIIMPIAIALPVLLAFSCAFKGGIAGGTSEETNAIVYNGVPKITGIDGQSQTALYFKKPDSYAFSVKDGFKFSAAAAAVSFDISAWVKIDSLPQKSEQPHNLIGKFSADSSSLPAEFSLALVNGACGADAPSFAFFLAEGGSVDCENAVLSQKPVEAKTWTFVRVKWDGRYLTLYQDSAEVASKEKIFAVLPFSQAPVYFGKSKITFAMDKLSLNTEAL